MTPNEFKSPTFRYREWYQGCGGKVSEKALGSNLHSVEDQLAGLEATGAWVAEPKRDGIWCAAFLDDRGVEFYSRTCERKPYSLDDRRIDRLDGTLFVGELGFGSQESLRRRAAMGFDFMDVYDVLYYQHTYVGDLNGEDRRDLLEQLFRAHSTLAPNYILCPQWTMQFAQHYADEPEGLILKPAAGFKYEGGGRKVKHWLKAKKDHTVDMVIMGWKQSEAETKVNEAHVEYIVCGAYVDGTLKELVHVGSMTRELSRAIACDYGAFHNQVVELKHFGQFKSGALRHPSVVRLRADKRPEDCTFDPENISAQSFRSL